MKQYIGISRDHSGSMRLRSQAALNDYNSNIAVIRDQATEQGIDTVISVVRCGVGEKGAIVREVVNSSVAAIPAMAPGSYVTDGSYTPLFDSIGELIEIMSSVPDASDPGVSFLVMAITDGQDNNSKVWSGKSLGTRIAALQATDRWTFIFRVPKGDAAALVRMGIPPGNIQEWELSARGMEVSTAETKQAFTRYYQARSSGTTSTKTFYTDLSSTSLNEIKAALVDVSSKVSSWHVYPLDQGRLIKEFIEAHTGQPLVKGTAFYELTKTEKEVQDYKVIVIKDKNSGHMYSGPAARQLLGLPTHGTVRVVPGDFSNYRVFIQSTSTKRKLVAGTEVLLYAEAAV